jgi:hypothetical protein
MRRNYISAINSIHNIRSPRGDLRRERLLDATSTSDLEPLHLNSGPKQILDSP